MAFNKPSTGDTVAATDINQLVEALDGTAAAGEPIKINQVDDAANYALDVQNLDTVAGYGLRVRGPDGLDVIKTNKDGTTLSKDMTVMANVKIDGVDVGSHHHTGVAGDGTQIPTEGIVNAAVTEAKLGALAVTEAKLGAGAVTEAKIGDGAVTAAKLSFDPATQAELDTHTGASAAIHGLGAGVSSVGCKQGVRRIEAKAGTQNLAEDDDFTISVVWDNEFATIIAVASTIGVSGDGTRRITAQRTLAISTTGASHVLYCGYGSGTTTFIEHFIALGT